VLLLVASQHGPALRLLPGLWCVRAYQSLTRPFKKHVRYVVLVQPSAIMRTVLTLMLPFLSHKAHAKIKQVNKTVGR
jgi:syndecan 1/collagen type V/XI/XXIV/XXVII alpha